MTQPAMNSLTRRRSVVRRLRFDVNPAALIWWLFIRKLGTERSVPHPRSKGQSTDATLARAGRTAAPAKLLGHSPPFLIGSRSAE
jgi:hypothetical protein